MALAAGAMGATAMGASDIAIPELEPERILFQGSGLLALDKPGGIPMHAGTDHPLGLAEIVAEWVKLHPRVFETRPGRRIRPLHLLDREVTGVALLGLGAAAARRVQDALACHAVGQRSIAVVSGPLESEAEIHGTVRSRGRGRPVTAHLVIRRIFGDERLSLAEIRPREGQTHSIRALLAGRGRPLAGDLRFGKPKPARQFLERFGVDHLLLHVLEVTLPASILGAPRTLRAPLPGTFVKVCRQKGWPVEEIREEIERIRGPEAGAP